MGHLSDQSEAPRPQGGVFCGIFITARQKGAFSEKTTRLKELFNRKEIFVLRGGACVIHARMAEALGYEAVYMSGDFSTAFLLGLPDAGLITMTEMVENAMRGANCVSIPLLADLDQSFANAINLRRAVQNFIVAGVSGIHIEAQTFPKRCGYVKGKEVVSLEEAAGKFRAAVDAINELDPDFIIMARTRRQDSGKRKSGGDDPPAQGVQKNKR
jgi:2-methylisocitrate lyase-like PEP mutase family enzyme